jgi:hypothetical protein
MYHLGFSFLFCPAGLPVSRDWLQLGDTTIQAHWFNQHQILPPVFLQPVFPAFPAVAGSAGADGSSFPEGGGSAAATSATLAPPGAVPNTIHFDFLPTNKIFT